MEIEWKNNFIEVKPPRALKKNYRHKVWSSFE